MTGARGSVMGMGNAHIKEIIYINYTYINV